MIFRLQYPHNVYAWDLKAAQLESVYNAYRISGYEPNNKRNGFEFEIPNELKDDIISKIKNILFYAPEDNVVRLVFNNESLLVEVL